jgi:hypothetical protein
LAVWFFYNPTPLPMLRRVLDCEDKKEGKEVQAFKYGTPNLEGVAELEEKEAGRDSYCRRVQDTARGWLLTKMPSASGASIIAGVGTVLVCNYINPVFEEPPSLLVRLVSDAVVYAAASILSQPIALSSAFYSAAKNCYAFFCNKNTAEYELIKDTPEDEEREDEENNPIAQP